METEKQTGRRKKKSNGTQHNYTEMMLGPYCATVSSKAKYNEHLHRMQNPILKSNQKHASSKSSNRFLHDFDYMEFQVV